MSGKGVPREMNKPGDTKENTTKWQFVLPIPTTPPASSFRQFPENQGMEGNLQGGVLRSRDYSSPYILRCPGIAPHRSQPWATLSRSPCLGSITSAWAAARRPDRQHFRGKLISQRRGNDTLQS
jgi:hypothetical protein